MKKPLLDRIEEKIVRIPECGCWIWMGSTTHFGHGQMSFEGRNEIVSRLSYALIHGPLDASEKVLHRCDVPQCVNPFHLFSGSQLDNVRDMDRKGRRAPGSKTARYGESNPQCQIPYSVVEQIRRSSGLLREVAAQFGISEMHVSRIRRGKQRACG